VIFCCFELNHLACGSHYLLRSVESRGSYSYKIIYSRYEIVARHSGKRGVMTVAESLISLEIERLPEGQYLATSSDLPGLVAQGRTIAECIEIAQDVARKLVESYVERGDALPAKLQHRIPTK